MCRDKLVLENILCPEPLKIVYLLCLFMFGLCWTSVKSCQVLVCSINSIRLQLFKLDLMMAAKFTGRL